MAPTGSYFSTAISYSWMTGFARRRRSLRREGADRGEGRATGHPAGLGPGDESLHGHGTSDELHDRPLRRRERFAQADASEDGQPDRRRLAIPCLDPLEERGEDR